MLYSQTCTMNTGLSTKSLKTIMIEPTVDDVLPKFILLLTKRHSKLMTITGSLNGNFYM